MITPISRLVSRAGVRWTAHGVPPARQNRSCIVRPLYWRRAAAGEGRRAAGWQETRQVRVNCTAATAWAFALSRLQVDARPNGCQIRHGRND